MTTLDLAKDLMAALEPACERLELAGSLRRCKPNPKDIELVAIAKTSDPIQELDLFGNVVAELVNDHLHNRLQELFAAGQWELDPVVRRNGPKYKRLRHAATGTACDLFITSPECWGVIFAIRTGPADFSQALVTRALRRGLKVDGGQLWKLHRDGRRSRIATLEERDFFAALRVPWLAPPDRSVEVLQKVLP